MRRKVKGDSERASERTTNWAPRRMGPQGAKHVLIEFWPGAEPKWMVCEILNRSNLWCVRSCQWVSHQICPILSSISSTYCIDSGYPSICQWGHAYWPGSQHGVPHLTRQSGGLSLWPREGWHDIALGHLYSCAFHIVMGKFDCKNLVKTEIDPGGDLCEMTKELW